MPRVSRSADVDCPFVPIACRLVTSLDESTKLVKSLSSFNQSKCESAGPWSAGLYGAELRRSGLPSGPLATFFLERSPRVQPGLTASFTFQGLCTILTSSASPQLMRPCPIGR